MNYDNFEEEVEIEIAVTTEIEKVNAPEEIISTNYLDEDYALVGKKEFIEAFQKKYPEEENLGILWDNIMGNVPFNSGSKTVVHPKNPQHPYVHYLTKDSSDKIIEHYKKFECGIDYDHLPKGFFFRQNLKESENGQWNVLDFSELLAANQAGSVSPLAVTLPSEEHKQEEKEEEKGRTEEIEKKKAYESLFKSSSDDPYKHQWWSLLLSNIEAEDGSLFCSKAELCKAFTFFSKFIKKNGLKFDKEPIFFLPGQKNTSADLKMNPITLIGRWHTVLSNKRLKLFNNLEAQWRVIQEIPLKESYFAIQVLANNKYTPQPCNFLLPDMQFYKYKRFDRNQNEMVYEGVNTVAHCRDIAGKVMDEKQQELKGKNITNDHLNESLCKFWRFIAFAPQCNSIEFYQQALCSITRKTRKTGETVFRQDSQRILLKVLAESTTGVNHCAKSKQDEAKELKIWQEICQEIADPINNLGGLSGQTIKLTYKAASNDKKKEHRQVTIEQTFKAKNPTMHLLKSMLDYTKKALKNANGWRLSNIETVGYQLQDLSNRLSRVVKQYPDKIYLGKRFYFVNGKWSKHVDIDIKKYVELQHYHISTETKYDLCSMSANQPLEMKEVKEAYSNYIPFVLKVKNEYFLYGFNEKGKIFYGDFKGKLLKGNKSISLDKILPFKKKMSEPNITSNIKIRNETHPLSIFHNENSRLLKSFLVAHLSTFTIETKDAIRDIYIHFNSIKSNSLNYRHNQAISLKYYTTFFEFSEELFSKAITPLQPQHLQGYLNHFCEFTQEEVVKKGLSTHEFYDKLKKLYLKQIKKEYGDFFPKNYFSEQIDILSKPYDSLTDQQKKRFRTGFSNEEFKAICQIVSTLLEHTSNIKDKELNALNNKFRLLKQRIPQGSRFESSLKRLVSLRGPNFSDYDAMSHLLTLLTSPESLKHFNVICIRNEIVKCNDKHLLSKINSYIENISAIKQELQSISSIASQETIATLFLKLTDRDINCDDDDLDEKYPENTNTNKKKVDYPSKIKTILKRLNNIVSSCPHADNYFIEAIHCVKSNDNQKYLDEVNKLINAFEQLATIFSPVPASDEKKRDNDDDNDKNAENMAVIYSLVSHYRQDPEKLITLVTPVDRMSQSQDKDKQRFLLSLISNLLDSRKLDSSTQSLDEIKVLLTQCEDPRKYKLIKQYCAKPPYPDITTLKQWLSKVDDSADDSDSKKLYEKFELAPFGIREQKYAFNLNKYKQQRHKFIGAPEDLFTDEVGEEFERLLAGNRNKSIQQLAVELQNAKQALQKAIKDNAHDNDNAYPQKVQKLLCLCVEFLARTTDQQHPEDARRISQECNTTQIMAVYLQLMHHNKNLINQMNTGEGKTRVFMILAAYMSSLGKTSDFVTDNTMLAEREYFAYKSFFKALQIPTSLINLTAPKALYQVGGVNFATDDLFLKRNHSKIQDMVDAFIDPSKENRVIFIDEQDALRKDKSGYAYNSAARKKELTSYTWVYPLLVEFMKDYKDENEEALDYKSLATEFLKFVAGEIRDNTRVARLNRMNEKRPEQLRTWLNSAWIAYQMKKGKDYTITSPERSERYLVIIDAEGHTRLTRKVFVLVKGRIRERYTFGNGLHQCICALQNTSKEQGGGFVILPENVTRSSSYVSTSLEKYDEMYAFSGSTDYEPMDHHRDINFLNYHYVVIPPEHPLRRDDRRAWLAKDEDQQVDFIIADILEATNNNKAVLLVCRDDNQSDSLKKKIAEKVKCLSPADQEIFNKMQYINSKTKPEQERAFIKNAGKPTAVTMVTGGMSGTGVDINSQDLHVIRCYIPIKRKDKQINGRTARFGKKGSTRMILNQRDEACLSTVETYNIENKIDEYQREMELEAAIQEGLAHIYADLFDKQQELFIASYKRVKERALKEKARFMLCQWEDFLKAMQQAWKVEKKKLAVSLRESKKPAFLSQLETFSENWDVTKKLFISVEEADLEKEEKEEEEIIISRKEADLEKEVEKIISRKEVDVKEEEEEKNVETVEKPLSLEEKVYRSILERKKFCRTITRKPLKIHDKYASAHQGQAILYSRFFEETRAWWSGKRRLFANYRAWREGRGVLFPNFKAILAGDRPAFLQLRTLIANQVGAKERFLAWSLGAVGLAYLGMSVAHVIGTIMLSSLLPFFFYGVALILSIGCLILVVKTCKAQEGNDKQASLKGYYAEKWALPAAVLVSVGVGVLLHVKILSMGWLATFALLPTIGSLWIVLSVAVVIIASLVIATGFLTFHEGKVLPCNLLKYRDKDDNLHIVEHTHANLDYIFSLRNAEENVCVSLQKNDGSNDVLELDKDDIEMIKNNGYEYKDYSRTGCVTVAPQSA